MKIDPNEFARPFITGTVFNDGEQSQNYYSGGLTIRAELASRNLAALLANAYTKEHETADNIAQQAVNYADLLIVKLNKESSL